jgi:hypothetical protein
VGDGGTTPGESRIRVRADQRDLAWCKDTVLREMVLRGVEDKSLVNDQGSGRGDAKSLALCVKRVVEKISCGIQLPMPISD